MVSIKKLGEFATPAANAVGVVLFAALFLVFILQVIARFAFNHPMAWTDELAVILYIWIVLWGAAFIVRSREHVMFDLLYNSCAPAMQRVMRLLGAVALAGLMGYALAGNWDYVLFMRREKTPVLGVSFFWVFVPFVLLLLSLVIRNVWAVWLDLKRKNNDGIAL